MIGSQLGYYRLLKLLGRGGFAEVYLGEHIYLKRPAAIKVLKMGDAPNEGSDAFLVEAQTVARLEHPHIIRILEFGVQQNVPFLVMDYAPDNLRAKYPLGTQIPLPLITSYVSQVASALQYAHEQKVIHRDVKPENMLIGQNHEVLLSDFGIARVVQHTGTAQTVQDVVGTVYYMAPEQFVGKASAASDQYALGVVVYQWLCGNLPFKGNNMFEVWAMHMNTPPPSLCAQDPTISLAVENVVMTALAKDPGQRYRSVLQFAAELEEAITGQTTQHAQSHNVLPPPPSATLATGSFATFSQEISPPFRPQGTFDPFQAPPTVAPSPLWEPTLPDATPLPEEPPPLLLPPASIPLEDPNILLQSAEPDNVVEIPADSTPVPLLPLSIPLLPNIDMPQEDREQDIAKISTIIASLQEEPSHEPPLSVLLPPLGTLLQKNPEVPPDSSVRPNPAATIRVVPPSPYRFFISYHEYDRRWAEWIQGHLKQNGYIVLLPERSDGFAIDLVWEMQEAMTMTDYIIIILSYNYLVTYDSQLAGFASIKSGLVRVLPIRIQECEHRRIMQFFNTSTCIDLVGLKPAMADRKLIDSIHRVTKPLFPDSADSEPVSKIKVFLSYAREDKAYRVRLTKYLKALEKQYPATSWHDGEIVAGEDFAQTIERQLRSAHIILLLVSQDFIASDYCYDKEMTKAMERHEADEARVIPIILRPSTWKDTPIGKLQALPSEGEPISMWTDKDNAFLDVTKGIKEAIKEMLSKLT